MHKPRDGRASTLAHIYAWETAAEQAVPHGLIVCHTCDNRCCVRNDDPGIYEVNGAQHPRRGHLWLGTIADNQADMLAKGRSARGERQHAAKLTPVQIMAIRHAAAQGCMYQDLAQQYSVDRVTISDAVTYKTWRHLP